MGHSHELREYIVVERDISSFLEGILDPSQLHAVLLHSHQCLLRL